MRVRKPAPDLDPMLERYALVHWECHRSGRVPRWGNLTITYTAADRVGLAEEIRKYAAETLSGPEDECLPNQIRIVGFFPIP